MSQILTSPSTSSDTSVPQDKKLLDQDHDHIRLKQYSPRTEKTYTHSVRDPCLHQFTDQIQWFLTYTDTYNNPSTTCFARKMGPIASNPVLVDIFLIHKNPVRVLLLSLPDTKKESPVPYSTVLISISRSRVWIMKSSVETVLGKAASRFVQECKPRAIYNTNVSQAEKQKTSSAMQICESARYVNFASCRPRGRV